MSNETTNQETTSTDLDKFKEYLKNGFEAGEAYTETFIDQLEKDYPNLSTDTYKQINGITQKEWE